MNGTTLTIEKLRRMQVLLRDAELASTTLDVPLAPLRPSLTGARIIIMSAAEQRRTPKDVPAGWVRPKVPSKAKGRKGTRRAWKRRHPPHMTFTYREPDSVLHWKAHGYQDVMVVTPRQRAQMQVAMGDTIHDHRIDALLRYMMPGLRNG